MNTKYFFLIILSICFATSVVAQRIEATIIMESRSNNPNELIYKKGMQLKLSDFQGPVEAGMHAIAMAYTGVSLQYSGSNKNGMLNLKIQLYTSFDKSRSWCMEQHKDDWTLAHEQRHFDITVINACMLYRALSSFSFSKNFEKEIAEMQTKYRVKNEQEQDEYDKATNHGINKEEQVAWNKKISETLSQCDDCFP
ncbi:MAG: DUF922 domain-containing protein [Chitinophagaceae bacterium]|nr:DUF922 domain-containing protein [Chitinophagaceae bacterium]